MGRKIFIVGMGRSGTHMLARVLASHPKVHASIEDGFVFPRITRMAVDPPTEARLYPQVVWALRAKHALRPGKHLVDKSHPALWIGERLAESFPRSLFVGIRRSPEGTIASSLKHRGVSGWHERWRQYPVPNRFLGIDEATAKQYDSMSRVAQLALRWRCHSDQLDRLRRLIGDRFLLVEYEAFALEARVGASELARFLGLAGPLEVSAVHADSVERWREELTAADVKTIRSLVADG